MHDTLVGVDIAKAVLQLAVSSRPGRFDSHRRLNRDQFLPFVAQLPPAVFILEACGTAHYWGRKIRQLGHAVVVLSPHLVRPYVRRNKTDRTDTVALVEAYRHGTIRDPRDRAPHRGLGRISKRGDAYLRMLFIHGARAVLSRAAEATDPDRLRACVLALRGRAPHNKAAVALANKMVRIAWAVSVRETDYRAVPAAA